MIENVDFLKRVLSIPTHSFQEDKMIEFLTDYLLEKKYDFHIDELGNIYVTKGQISEGEFYPCVVAHTDTVHKIDTINIREEYLKDSKGKEYSKNVLFGNNLPFYISLICINYNIYKTDQNIPKYIKMHIDHGLGLISNELVTNPNLSGFDFLLEKIDSGLNYID